MINNNNDPETENEPQNSPSTTTVDNNNFPRVGKIARLPRPVREKLNRRLEVGEGGESLLDWLNQLPEAIKLIGDEFGGRPINKQNLSDWRRGGFAEWQLRHDLLEQAGETCAHVTDLNQAGKRLLVDDVVTVFISRYNALLTHWNGEVTEPFEAKLRVFARIRRDLSRLQRDAHWAVRDADECEQIDLAAEKRKIAALQHKALAPHHAALRRQKLSLEHGIQGDKMSELLNTIEYGEPYPSFFTNHIEEPPQTEPESKPARRTQSFPVKKSVKKRSVRQASTAKPKAPSQGTPKSAEHVAVEPSGVENASGESSQVKPVSETVVKPLGSVALPASELPSCSQPGE